MARKIVITSGKGGVGKTTIVEGLGVALSRLGYKTLLIDMDFGLNNLDVVLGIENKIVYDIIDVIDGRCRASQAVIEDMYENNLYIFPTIHSFCKNKFGVKELTDIISQIENSFDIVLIDCPAGMDGGFRRAIGCADEYIIVTTPHLSAIRDADKIISQISTISSKRPYLIINRARGDLMLNKEMLNIESIKNNLNCKLIGVVPEDDSISKKLYFGRNIDNVGQAEISFGMIARVITSDREEIFDVTKRYKGLIGGLRKKIRGKI